MAKSTPALWERQPGESSKAYAAFTVYRDLGPQRSLPKAAQTLQKSKSTLCEWSGRHEWVKRCTAWDEEQDRIARQAQVNEIKKMRKRHADLATAMLVKAAKALQSLPADEIKAADVSRMVETASKLERLSRGDVGEVIEERDGGTATPAVTFYMPENNRETKTEEQP